MPDERIRRALRTLRREYTSKKAGAFIDDMEGQIEEDADIEELILKSRYDRQLAVSIDRRRNITYDYPLLDTLLRFLDLVNSGHGLLKPVNQLRVLKWGGTRTDLLKVLVYFSTHNAPIQFRRALVTHYDRPSVGHNLDPFYI